jgi:hypothetical protein
MKRRADNKPWAYQHKRQYRQVPTEHFGPGIHTVGSGKLHEYFDNVHEVYVMLAGHDRDEDFAMWFSFLQGERVVMVTFAGNYWLDLNDERGIWFEPADSGALFACKATSMLLAIYAITPSIPEGIRYELMGDARALSRVAQGLDPDWEIG